MWQLCRVLSVESNLVPCGERRWQPPQSLIHIELNTGAPFSFSPAGTWRWGSSARVASAFSTQTTGRGSQAVNCGGSKARYNTIPHRISCLNPSNGHQEGCASLAPTSTPPAAGSANTAFGSASSPNDPSISCPTPNPCGPKTGCPNSSGAACNISGLSDFLTTPTSKSKTFDFHRWPANKAQSGQSRLLAAFETTTARPTGFGYAHRPLRYPTRRRESRIIQWGTQPGNDALRILSALPST